jgi:chromate transport protein ChrA
MDNLKYLATIMITLISITEINTLITSLVLLATLIYWIQKNINQYITSKRKNKNADE